MQDSEVVRIAARLSRELGCELDEESLRLVVQLLEQGVPAGALAQLILKTRTNNQPE